MDVRERLQRQEAYSWITVTAFYYLYNQKEQEARTQEEAVRLKEKKFKDAG